MNSMSKLLITQIKSSIGIEKRQRANLKSLGLRKIRHQVVKESSPEILGMVKKVAHLIKVKEEI